MQRWLIAAAALAAATALVAALAIRAQVGAGPLQASATLLPAGTAVSRLPPPVALRDAGGARVSLRDLRGRWLALAPTLTSCHEVCPITTGALLRLRALMRRMGAGGRFAAIEVSVDPWRDSPARLRAYRRRTGAHLRILTGSEQQLRRLWRFFGIGFRRAGGDVVHGDGLFLLDPSGRERVAFAGMPSTGGRLPPRLRSLLDAEGRRNLAHPRAPWTPRQAAADLRLLMGLRAPLPGAQRVGRPARPSRLLDGDLLEARLRALRGRPVVLNAWASWCPPCRDELPLFASAAARFGPRVAFLGADVEDDSTSARQLLAEIPLGYPSYATSLGDLGSLDAATGTPFTVFLDRAGEIVGRHIGAYRSQRELDADIAALGGG
ncbi:MAG TPA: SCO family protein [Solirubrobacterales bacterium]|nr:SCO family protein [Solirubrobacterales bacterium]